MSENLNRFLFDNLRQRTYVFATPQCVVILEIGAGLLSTWCTNADDVRQQGREIGKSLMFADTVAQLDPAMDAEPVSKSILVIDDDVDQVEVLRHRLDSQGYRTISASTGQQGFQLATDNVPDLILLDLRLPDTDGLTVCQRLSDNPLTAPLPVIILSGMERPDIIRRTRSAGSQYYVRKPYDPNVLLVLIENALQSNDDW